jgi:hypothetical protein
MDRCSVDPVYNAIDYFNRVLKLAVYTLETERLSTVTSRSNEDQQFEHLRPTPTAEETRSQERQKRVLNHRPQKNSAHKHEQSRQVPEIKI